MASIFAAGCETNRVQSGQIKTRFKSTPCYIVATALFLVLLLSRTLRTKKYSEVTPCLFRAACLRIVRSIKFHLRIKLLASLVCLRKKHFMCFFTKSSPQRKGCRFWIGLWRKFWSFGFARDSAGRKGQSVRRPLCTHRPSE